MMSQMNLKVTVGIEAETKKAEAEVDKLVSTWARVKYTIQHEVNLTMRTIQNAVSIVRNVFSALGLTMDPMLEAVLAVISTVASTIISINIALAAGSGGTLTGLAIAFSLAGLAITVLAETKAILGMNEAKKIGLPVTSPSEDIEQTLWQIWQDIEEEMECNRPFNPVEVVLRSKEASALLGPVPQIQLPVNLPPQLMEQAFNNILQQIRIVIVPPVDYNLFQATLESVWCKSEFRTSGKINATRLPNMNIAVSVVQVSSGWTFAKNPNIPQEAAK